MFRPVIAWMTSFNLLFWATDAWVLASSPGASEALGHGRAILLGLAVVAWLVGSVSLRRIYVVATLFAVPAYWVIADTLGRIGGPSTAWFHFLYPFMLAPVAGWVRPLHRVAVMACLGGAALHGYFHGRPAWWADPLAWVAVGHLGYVLALSFVIGSYVDLKRLEFFRLQRALEREKATLGARVDEQTESLRRLARHLSAAQEAEQQRIARDLHDELGQMVVATRYVLQATLDRYREAPDAIGPNLGQLAALLDRYSAIVRNFLQDLHPRMLEQLGLGPALRWLAGRMQETAGLDVALALPDALPALPDDVARAAFRCVQEALTNVAKHAGVQAATLTVRCDAETITLEVGDAGVGFDAADTLRRSTGSGLVGQRERARAVGGEVELHGGPGSGTQVRIRLPLGDATMPMHLTGGTQ